MSQDATKVLMGSTMSNDRPGTEVFANDPATYLAGLAVRRNSSNLLSLLSTDGRFAGVSLGANLSDSKKVTVLKAGLKVPMLLEAEPARGSISINTFANLLSTSADTFTVGATVFTAQAGAATAGTGTFQAATSDAATAASLAAQINAHAVAGALVNAVIDSVTNTKINLTAKLNTSAGNAIALAYTDTHATSIGGSVSGATLTGGGATTDFVVIGAHVYISNTTGKADDPSSDSTISNAIYASSVLTGVQEDGTSAAAVLVDMSGGL